MSNTTISDNEGVPGHTSPFLGNSTEKDGRIVDNYRKILETLEGRRKKRNEVKRQITSWTTCLTMNPMTLHHFSNILSAHSNLRQTQTILLRHL